MPPTLRVPPERCLSPYSYRSKPDVHDRLQRRWEDQGRKCAICETTEPGGKHRTFIMDHCHDTGFVRSMLCNRCNIAIPPWADAVVTRLACQRLKKPCAELAPRVKELRANRAARVERLACYLEFWESMFAYYRSEMT
jgi:Recombination endonuclease VII